MTGSQRRGMLRRHIESIIPSSLSAFPIVLLTGGRQVGKSTLLLCPSERAYVLSNRMLVAPMGVLGMKN